MWKGPKKTITSPLFDPFICLDNLRFFSHFPHRTYIYIGLARQKADIERDGQQQRYEEGIIIIKKSKINFYFFFFFMEFFKCFFVYCKNVFSNLSFVKTMWMYIKWNFRLEIRFWIINYVLWWNCECKFLFFFLCQK